MRFFAGPTLLVIDELGPALPAEVVKNLIAGHQRALPETPIVITTNRPVGA
jgi:hypothetical protein